MKVIGTLLIIISVAGITMGSVMVFMVFMLFLCNNAFKAVTSYTPSPGEFRELETENDKLKKLLGEKDLEIAILRDLVKKVNPVYRTKWK